MSATNNIPLGRLDYDTREEIFRRLRDRQSGRQINAWLISTGKAAQPYRDQNFTNLRQGLFKKWLSEQRKNDLIREAAESSRREVEAAGETIFDKLAYDFAAALADAKLVATPENIVKLAGAASVVIQARTAQLRAADSTRRTVVAESALDLDRDKFQRETCELFLKWFADERARKIAESNATNGEKIAALRQAYFADVEALDKSGAVKLPE